MTAVNSFSAILGDQPKLLILGSMPGVASLEQQRYYAHPRNSFWPIISELLNTPLPNDYSDRLTMLKQNHVALWDVIAECHREGSLDSAIQKQGLIYNPIDQLITAHPTIGAIAVNGNKAHTLLKRAIRDHVINLPSAIKVIALTSTSPANARLNLSQKLDKWRILSEYL